MGRVRAPVSIKNKKKNQTTKIIIIKMILSYNSAFMFLKQYYNAGRFTNRAHPFFSSIIVILCKMIFRVFKYHIIF